MLYKPNENFSIVAMAMEQNLEMGGYDLIDGPPGLPYMAHYEAFNTPEPINDRVHIYSLTFTGNFGFAELTSATSYWDRLAVQTQDAAESIYTTLAGAVPLVPVPYSETDPSHQFSQEIRLSSIGNGGLHWTVGAFYSDMTSDWNEYGANPANTGAPGGIYFQSYNPYNIKQTALFADGSYKFTDTLTLSAGVRWYHYDSTIDVSEWGLVTPNPTQPASPSVTEASDKGFNPRINLSYEANGNLNTYITAAKGFRPGGANILIPPPNQAPFCVAGSPGVVRTGLRLELRDRREGEAVRQPGVDQQRFVLHQVDRHSAERAAGVRLRVQHERRRRPLVWPRTRGDGQAVGCMDRGGEWGDYERRNHAPHCRLCELALRYQRPGLLPGERQLHDPDPQRDQAHAGSPACRWCTRRTWATGIGSRRARATRIRGMRRTRPTISACTCRPTPSRMPA